MDWGSLMDWQVGSPGAERRTGGPGDLQTVIWDPKSSGHPVFSL